jgi:predicted nuclease of predicted toxin-antitoxin system
MPFLIKVDEDLPTAVNEVLKSANYDSTTVLDQNMGGYKDEPLWKAVQKEKRFLITADKGFGDIRFYPPGTHAGVLVLRPDEDGIRPVVELMEQVLSQFKMDELAGTVAVATPRGVRVRRPSQTSPTSEENKTD